MMLEGIIHEVIKKVNDVRNQPCRNLRKRECSRQEEQLLQRP
jgi:hypothetical protein